MAEEEAKSPKEGGDDGDAKVPGTPIMTPRKRTNTDRGYALASKKRVPEPVVQGAGEEPEKKPRPGNVGGVHAALSVQAAAADVAPVEPAGAKRAPAADVGSTTGDIVAIPGIPSAGLPRNVWIGAGVLSSIAIVTIIVALALGGDDGETAEAEEPTADDGPTPAMSDLSLVEPPEGTDLAVIEAAEGTDDGDATDGVETIRVSLTGVPEGATIRLDGEEVDGPSFEVPGDEENHRVTVTAAGFRTWRSGFRADTDRALVVELVERDGEPRTAMTEMAPAGPGVDRRGLRGTMLITESPY